VTRARTAVDGAASSVDAGHLPSADPRGLDEADVARRLKQGQGNWAKLPSSRSLAAILRAMGAAYVVVLAIPATREFIALDASPWIVALAAVGAAALRSRRGRAPPVRRTGNATTPLPIEEAVHYIGSRWLGQTTGPILEALVGRRR